MLSDKDSVKSFTDEVKELHPLLHKLLPRLPESLATEYTHGTREFGADFVVHMNHPTLGIPVFIGVIAKIGKLHQNLESITQQIEECKIIPRAVFSGRFRTSLNEIWVVLTDQITTNAKDKIHERFGNTNILFVSGSELDRLVGVHLPTYWTDVTPEVNDYLTAVRLGLEQQERTLSLLPEAARDLYVEPHLEEVRTDALRARGSRSRPPKPVTVEIEDAITKNDSIFVEGMMGSGKSRLLRELAKRLSLPATFRKLRILPVCASFHELQSQFQNSLAQLIAARTQGVPEVSEESTRVLVLIDGFDEVKMTEAEALETIAGLASQQAALPRTKLLIASRDFGKSAELRNEGFRVLSIRPLSTAQIIRFLTAICTRLNLSSRLIEDLKGSALFRDLPRNPIAAILLAKLIEENSDDLPASITELYSKYTELALGRWDINKGLQSQREFEVRHQFVVELAQYLLTNGLDGIAIGEAKQRLSQYLDDRNLELDADDVYERLCQRCELLLADKETHTLAFKHRTFAEYFLAEQLYSTGDFTLSEEVFTPYWMNTYFFLVGLQCDAPELVKSLVAMRPTEESKRWVRLASLGDFLVAAYRTPYSVIEEALEASISDAAEFYLDIRHRRIDSRLVDLPPIVLLYFVQLLVRHSYSYSFLQRASESVALRFLEERERNDQLAYQLFFLAMASREAGNSSAFDLMLEEIGKTLPAELAIAIEMETQGDKKKSSILRKFEKRLHDSVKGNPSFASFAKDIVSRPIKLLKK